jgi:dTDP-4-dehydrorhamnose 3,5-epimerase-like enzyme
LANVKVMATGLNGLHRARAFLRELPAAALPRSGIDHDLGQDNCSRSVKGALRDWHF